MKTILLVLSILSVALLVACAPAAQEQTAEPTSAEDVPVAEEIAGDELDELEDLNNLDELGELDDLGLDDLDDLEI